MLWRKAKLPRKHTARLSSCLFDRELTDLMADQAPIIPWQKTLESSTMRHVADTKEYNQRGISSWFLDRSTILHALPACYTLLL